MIDRFVRAGFIKALMSQRDGPGRQSGQQFLDPGRAFPGQDAGGPLDTAQRLDDWGHGLRATGVVDHQSGQIVAKGAPSTGFTTVEIAFGRTCGKTAVRPSLDPLVDCVSDEAIRRVVRVTCELDDDVTDNGLRRRIVYHDQLRACAIACEPRANVLVEVLY